MKAYESEEVTRGFLARLPHLAADAARAERTRQQCRALLGRQRRGRERLRAGVDGAKSVLTPAAVGAFCAFCVLYFGALVATAMLLEAPFG